MGMTIDNLCDSCTNIGCKFQSGIVRRKCAFYMPPHIAVNIQPDNCGNYVVMQPTVEVIPKDQYETRLKADLEAVLEDLDLLIDEFDSGCGWDGYIKKIDVHKLIQQKINVKGEETDGKR